MSVLGRILLSSGERVDLADLLSIDSYSAGDLKYLLTSFVGDDTPYIIQGFDVIQPQSAVGTQSCSINVANAAVYFPGSTAGPFFFGLPNATALVPELRQSAVNYVYLTLTTGNTSADTRAFWDPDANGGNGGEFTQEVDTESVLEAQVGVSVGSFPSGTVPIAIITMGAVVITSIEDARTLMFRLGTGGVAPNPYNSFAWPALPSTQYEREEPPNTITAGGVNPFQGADKNIKTLKQWMDAVMSKLKELGGTTFWYEDTSTLSLVTLFTDALATTYKTKGQYQHSSATPGLFTWTEDINIKITSDPRTYIIRAGNVTLANEQVAYLDLIRNDKFNSTDSQVFWTNGQNYINTIGGAIGLFANLSQGDWVKRPSDPGNYFLRVEQFYDSVNGGGSVTTAANAKSIILSGNYQGPTLADVGRRDQGVYLSGNVVVSNRNNPAIDALGGNFSWLALRSDTIEGISNAVVTSLTANISASTGGAAQVTCSTPHNLQDDDYITISGSTNFNGTYQVTVDSTTVFSINVANSHPAETARTVRYAVITTTTTLSSGGLQLESANHCFATDDTVIIAGTTNFNGSFKVSVRDATHFNIAIGGAYATETTGTATLAKILVRAESGAVTVVQGGSVSPDGPITNIKLFIGMNSDSETHPVYSTTPSYNTLFGQYNFNSLATDNVTVRLSNLTAMMADRAQDKTIKYLPDNILLVGNTTNGSAQEITFTSNTTPTLTILQPGGPGNAVITLPTVSPGISLLVDQSAYISINRNAGTTPTWTVADNDLVPVAENVFVIATRLEDDNIYLWDGSIWPVGETPFAGSGTGIRKVDLYDPLDTSLPTGTVTIDGVSVNAGMQVLFSGLSTPVIESSQLLHGNTMFPNFTGITDLGTSQIVTTYNATSVDFFLSNSGTATGSMVCNIYDIIGGIATLIGTSQSVNIATIPVSPSAVTFTFSPSVPITTINSNVKYFVLTPSSLVNPSALTMYGTSPQAGTGSKIYSTTGGPPFANNPTESPYIVVRGSSGSGNNEIYEAVGSGATIASWTPQYAFNGNLNPSAADLVIISQGTAFANQIGEFNGTTWQFNNVVRYFGLGNDVANYWEQSGLMTTTLSDNTTNGTVFSVGHLGSENIVVDYSVLRGSGPEFKVTGSLYITTDGTNVSVVESGATLNGVSGVTFDGVISGSNLILRYTTTSTGVSATMKYSIKRWSDAAGGPSGPPSYSAASGSGVTSLNGESGAVTLIAGSNITITPVGSNITIASTGGSGPVLQGPFTILDNQSSPVTLFSYVASTNLYVVFEYSVLKGGSYRVGRLMVATDASSIASLTDDFAETGTSGVSFSAQYTGGNINIQYTSTNTGSTGSLKYYMTGWS